MIDNQIQASETLKSSRPKARKLIVWFVIAVIGLCLVATTGLFIWNQNLPTESTIVDLLSEAEKARLAEAIHLHSSLGEAVWPGWGETKIPIIVYNEGYAFLIGYPDPPAGWIKIPQNQLRGSTWELVPGDDFAGEPYYRQPLPNPEITPENFTVLVGDRWVATLQTKEYSRVAFYQGFSQELPPFIRTIFPYALVWSFLGGDTEVYIGGLAHEIFHAFQGTTAPERLNQAEMVAGYESSYPWDDAAHQKAWQEELALLVEALQAETDKQAVLFTRQFLEERQKRRAGLSANQIDYERQREWLEGLAKYAELSLLRQAALTPAYHPVLSGDPDFEDYQNSLRYFEQQKGEVKRTASREGETRFYYGGMAQALLLDRLLPNWKSLAMEADIWLDSLLSQAVSY